VLGFEEILAMASLMRSFVDVTPGSQFPIQNLPFGVFRPSAGASPRPGVAIGDSVVDLSVLSDAGLFCGPLLSESSCFTQVAPFPTHRLSHWFS
jgi:fumarylacetoacetase